MNGKKVGEHVGGFTPFNFDVSEEVADGDNSIVVEVNNTRSKDGVPALSTDWWNYGGLTRSVELIEVPETFIQDYSVQLAKGRTDEVVGWVQLNGGSGQHEVTIEIPEAHVKQTAQLTAGGGATRLLIFPRSSHCGRQRIRNSTG